MFKIIGFLILAAVILYLGFREEKPRIESGTGKAVVESISPKVEQAEEAENTQKAKVAMSGQETTEADEPVVSNEIKSDEETVESTETVADTKPLEESVTDSEKADEEPQEEKRKLVGGAEVEWIEPDTSKPKTKFGQPPS